MLERSDTTQLQTFRSYETIILTGGKIVSSVESVCLLVTCTESVNSVCKTIVSDANYSITYSVWQNMPSRPATLS